MLNTLKQTIIIDFSITLNSWIYFLKRIPLVKRLFHNTGYEHTELTRVIFTIGLIYSMFKQLMKSALSLLLSFGLSYLLIRDKLDDISMEKLYFHIFIIFYLLLALPNGKILEPQRRKFICVKLMRMNAKRFVISDYFPKLIWRQIIEIPLFCITAAFFSVNIVFALFLVITKNLFAAFVEVMNLKYYDRTGRFLHNKIALNLLYALFIICLGYFSASSAFIIAIPDSIILSLGVILWIIGILSVIFLYRYANYPVAINDANQLNKLSTDYQTVKKNAEFSKVKLKDNEFSQKALKYDKSNKKEGFIYINDIFFKRHKRILNSPIKKQSIAILFLFAAGIVASNFIPEFNKEYVTTVKKAFPVFIFVLYLISTGQKATKAMFYNCDISLLHYGFYKTKDAVLATFTIRMQHLILANIVPAGLMAAAVIMLDILSGGSFLTLLPIAAMILTLSIFFVINSMFLYYIFQPYTTDLNVKNPFYKLFNFITYILCYISLQLRNVSLTFLFIVIIVTIIYMITALITVYRIAPRTFMIK